MKMARLSPRKVDGWPVHLNLLRVLSIGSIVYPRLELLHVQCSKKMAARHPCTRQQSGTSVGI